MEFKLITKPQKITFNNNELKSEISEKLESYKNLIVTENSLKSAMEDRANLNKLSKFLTDKKIEIKKELIEDFEKDVKELTDMIKDVSTSIDIQIKSFEDAEKSKKKNEIESYYFDKAGNLSKIVEFNKIFDEKWLNKTYKIKDINFEIEEIIEKIKVELDTIKSLNFEKEQQILNVYLETLNLSKALAEKSRLEDLEKRLKDFDENVENSVEIVENVVEELKTIKVVFYETSQEFRKEMKKLTLKFGVNYGNI